MNNALAPSNAGFIFKNKDHLSYGIQSNATLGFFSFAYFPSSSSYYYLLLEISYCEKLG